MKKLFPLVILIFIISSCTVMTMEPYRTADTLGAPLRFRVGLDIQSGQLIPEQTNPDTLSDIGVGIPAGKLYAGIGIWNNIDAYASASYGFPLSVDYGGGIKYQYIDKLGFKAAVVPHIKYAKAEDMVVLEDTLNYKLIGGELPFAFTYSIINIIMISGGVHAGYYQLDYTDQSGVSDKYNFMSYGAFIMPEIKLGVIRVSLGVDYRRYYSPKMPIKYSDTYSPLQRNFHPFLSLSLQF